MPSHGRFTIDLATGRVLSSELIAESGSLRARIEVTYALEPTMELFVPREMREKYTLSDGSSDRGQGDLREVPAVSGDGGGDGEVGQGLGTGARVLGARD